MRSKMDCKGDPNVTEIYDAEALRLGTAPERQGRKLILADHNNSAMILNNEFANGDGSARYQAERVST